MSIPRNSIAPNNGLPRRSLASLGAIESGDMTTARCGTGYERRARCTAQRPLHLRSLVSALVGGLAGALLRHSLSSARYVGVHSIGIFGLVLSPRCVSTVGIWMRSRSAGSCDRRVSGMRADFARRGARCGRDHLSWQQTPCL